MSNSLSGYLNKKVVIILVDGRTVVGTLVSCDQVTNLALKDCQERVIRPVDHEEPSSVEEVGVFLVRGEQVVVCGLVDEKLDESIEWREVHGSEIGSTKHV